MKKVTFLIAACLLTLAIVPTNFSSTVIAMGNSTSTMTGTQTSSMTNATKTMTASSTSSMTTSTTSGSMKGNSSTGGMAVKCFQALIWHMCGMTPLWVDYSWGFGLPVVGILVIVIAAAFATQRRKGAPKK